VQEHNVVLPMAPEEKEAILSTRSHAAQGHILWEQHPPPAAHIVLEDRS
jgi:hypothetical protein